MGFSQDFPWNQLTGGVSPLLKHSKAIAAEGGGIIVEACFVKAAECFCPTLCSN